MQFRLLKNVTMYLIIKKWIKFFRRLASLKIERLIQFYCEMARKENYVSNEILW